IGANINYPHCCVERARDSSGVLDDVIAWNKFSSTAAGLEARHVNASVGQVNDAPPLCLLPSLVGGAAGTSNPAIPSLESGDASEVVVIGPYFVGGDPLFAPPRLAFIASPEDVADGSDRELTIDGSSKTYRAMPDGVA